MEPRKRPPLVSDRDHFLGRQSRGAGGATTPLYLPHRYVPPQRVEFLRRFGLKTAVDFAYFGLNSGMLFEGMRERICRFSSK